MKRTGQDPAPPKSVASPGPFAHYRCAAAIAPSATDPIATATAAMPIHLRRVRIVMAASAIAIWISVIACAQRWCVCIDASLRSSAALLASSSFFASGMPLALQVKLLRVLQEGEVRPVGATQSIPVAVRVISATHRDLDEQKAAGQFREDLYYRLNVVSLKLPALADRREDIPLLATHFLRRLAERYKRPAPTLAPDAMALLIAAPWPGNVRQLLNLLEQAVALATTNMIPASLIQSSLREDASALVPFEEARKEFERDYLVRLLKITGGNVTQAALLAKRNRTEFYKLLQRHRLEPAMFKEGKSS